MNLRWRIKKTSTNHYKEFVNTNLNKLVHEIWNASTCTSIGIHRGINRRLSFYAFEFWKKYKPSVREIRATYWNNLLRDKFMCIDIQTDRPTYIKWFTVELRNNPSLAKNTVHTLMMTVYFGLWYLHVWSYINKVFWFVVVFERRREHGRVEKKGGSEVLFPSLTFLPLPL